MESIEDAARRIRNGELVAFPTETVYGLGANALDSTAVKRIFETKGRPEDNPCIVHVASREMLEKVVKNVPQEAENLIEAFWPGPLTIIFERSDEVPDEVTAGLPTVAVRMPRHPMALDLIRKAGVPIAAPSANRSGRPSPTRATHVRTDFPDVPVLDGGTCERGLESTVVALHGRSRVLRQGSITLEELEHVLPGIAVADSAERPESPGQKYRHYAPAKPLMLFRDIGTLKAYADEHPDATVLCMTQHAREFDNTVVRLGDETDEVAQNLFDALRTAPGEELLVLAVPKRGLGRTIMDRLERAATEIR